RKTAIFVTHQIDEAVYLSDRVLVFTVRPGRLKEEVRIDLPRPRQLDVKRTPEFVRYTNHIWQLIEQEVRDGIGLEAREAAALHAGEPARKPCAPRAARKSRHRKRPGLFRGARRQARSWHGRGDGIASIARDTLRGRRRLHGREGAIWRSEWQHRGAR